MFGNKDFKEAMDLCKRGQFQLAIELLQADIQRLRDKGKGSSKACGERLYWLGSAFVMQEAFVQGKRVLAEEAVPVLSRHSSLSVLSGRALYSLGYCCNRLGEAAEASEWLRRALSVLREPLELARCHNQLAEAALAMGRLDDAKASARAAEEQLRGARVDGTSAAAAVVARGRVVAARVAWAEGSVERCRAEGRAAVEMLSQSKVVDASLRREAQQLSEAHRWTLTAPATPNKQSNNNNNNKYYYYYYYIVAALLMVVTAALYWHTSSNTTTTTTTVNTQSPFTLFTDFVPPVSTVSSLSSFTRLSLLLSAAFALCCGVVWMLRRGHTVTVNSNNSGAQPQLITVDNRAPTWKVNDPMQAVRD